MNRTVMSASRRFGSALALYVALAVSPSALSYAGDSLVGRVVAVKSGDLITLDYGAGREEVRIAGIEIDRREPMALEAKEALSDMILDKVVRLRFDGYLPNGEMSGRLWLGGIGGSDERVRDVGVELVRAGKVRSVKGYPEYKYGEMSRAQAEAIQTRRGVWQ